MSLLRRPMLIGIRVPYLLYVVGLVMSLGCDAGYSKPALRFESQPELSPVLFQGQAALDSALVAPYLSGSIDPATGWPRVHVKDVGVPAKGGLGTGHPSVPNATDATSWEKVRALYR